MSNKPNPRKWTRTRPPSEPRPGYLSDEVYRYAEALAATGMPEREVARAAYYAQEYGLASMSGEGCAVFSEPNCGDWDCVRPDHQVLERQ